MYCTRADLEDRYGAAEIGRVADLRLTITGTAGTVVPAGRRWTERGQDYETCVDVSLSGEGTASVPIEPVAAGSAAELVTDVAGVSSAASSSQKLAAAIADTAAEIDAVLGRCYELPLAGPGALLMAIAADLVRRRLYDDRVTDAVRHAAQRQRAVLKSLGAGGLRLLDSAGAVVQPRCSFAARTGPTPQAGELLEDYI